MLIVGLSGVWFYSPGDGWDLLAPGDAVRPSTHLDRAWVRTVVVDDPDGLRSEFLWTEIDNRGVVYRSSHGERHGDVDNV